jgi:hypothetical protein
VVSPEDEKVFGILDLVRQEEADSLQRLFTPIDVVAEKEVICFWWKSSIFEKTEKVVILAVNVTC